MAAVLLSFRQKRQQDIAMLGGHMIGIRWSQVDFDSGLIALDPDETKNREGRQVPILEGDMEDLLLEAKKARDDAWPNSEWVFNRQGKQVKDIRGSWRLACIATGVPELNFHDLRRTAVRNMRRAGVPQVIRMKISGHKTDSMERRYNIVDEDDINIAKEFMQRRRKSAKEL
jgi:integrase